MSQLSAAVHSFRRAILDREEASLAELIQAFLDAYSRIDVQLTFLQKRIAEAKKNGEDISAGWLAKEERFTALIGQIGTDIAAFAAYADTHIGEQQRIAVFDAVQHSQELMRLAQGDSGIPATFTRYNPVAALDIIGKLSEGSPLRDLLDTIAPEAVTRARAVLVTSIVAGDNPRTTARGLRDELNISLNRAATIARTEVLGAYRQASIDTYAANGDVVKGWIWQADFGPRTCAMCIAMSGTFHSLEEPFGSHPNCRCTPIPETKTWAELGFEGIPDTRPIIESGVDWFSRQTDKTQLAILGKEKLNLYKAGKLQLSELIGARDDSKWGLTRYEKSLKAVLADR